MSKKTEQNTDFYGQAAVLIGLTQISDSDHVLLTKRAEHLNSHSGEVAFPGGMWEAQDASLAQTALRETHEEVGLEPERIEISAMLPACSTRQGVTVTPFAARIDSSEGLVASPDELDALFWVPLDFFHADERLRTDIFTLEGQTFWSPVYQFEGYEIWGFTARLMVEFLNSQCGGTITREHRAPEKTYVI